MSAFGKCRCDCQHEKQNHFIMSALFCQRDFLYQKIKPKKKPYTQANMCLLHISRNFKVIISLNKLYYILINYKLYSLSLTNCEQLRKCNCLYRSSLSVMFFFSIDIRSNQFRFDLIMQWHSLYSEILLQHII